MNNVSFYGIGQGNARGAVPSARIAAYKACWDGDCFTDDVLAAFDDAISDGVDILSVSLGGRMATSYDTDPVAIGSFHAMQHGILTSNSAGNSGPRNGSISSVAPWLLTVAASTTDRKIIDKVVLGDYTTFVGRAVNSFEMTKKVPLINGGDVYSYNNKSFAGKIVLYNGVSNGEEALEKNASGMIIRSNNYQDYALVFPLPTSLLDISNGGKVESYINNTENPETIILKSQALKDANAPVVASFSSRGPNSIVPEILKPDITAPGVDILAAWPTEIPPTGLEGDPRSVKYNIISGTSMSCPHVTGAAAYVKTFNPDWSPSAIKSTLMTTASPLNPANNPVAEFSYGSGHINPVNAVNPGLVYDALEEDYIQFLCSIGFTPAQMKLMSGKSGGCPKSFSGSPNDLNYSSMVSTSSKANFTRTVTNVGEANSTYKAIITSPSNVEINVTPNVLSFKASGEKQSFVVTVSTTSLEEDKVYSGSLVWSECLTRFIWLEAP